jgi:hypothetical protein
MHIHLDLDSLFVPKTDLDKVIFGLFKYVQQPGPHIFTANVSTKDMSYLGVLKNNNVRIVDAVQAGNDTIVFCSKWKEKLPLLLMTQNLPTFAPLGKSNANIYIDWDNVQVAPEYILALLNGIKGFIHGVKVHQTYKFYIFLHSKVSPRVRKIIEDTEINIINIIKDKANSGDGEMIRFIRESTDTHDSQCIVSGDRDFSPLMVEYVRKHHNVFLVYNKQALYTFKHNRHWLSSINIKSIEGVNTRTKTAINRKCSNTKPCKFYNLDVCNAISCSFLHICGVCGRPHKMRDFHPQTFTIKKNICKNYNRIVCGYNNIVCDDLHICIKCKQPHPYANCDQMIMYCPLCKTVLSNIIEYVKHQFEPNHKKIIDTMCRIVDTTSKFRLVL